MREQWSACSKGDPPAWMDASVWPRFPEMTRLRILGALNALAFIFYASFMSIVLALSANLDSWENTRGVTLPIYKAKLDWYSASEMNLTTTAFELVPTLIRGNDQQAPQPHDANRRILWTLRTVPSNYHSPLDPRNNILLVD